MTTTAELVQLRANLREAEAIKEQRDKDLVAAQAAVADAIEEADDAARVVKLAEQQLNDGIDAWCADDEAPEQ